MTEEMDDLKTLKDLGREREIYDLDTGRLKGWDRVLYFNDVKAEAVKWVKNYNKFDGAYGLISKAFMDFFNLTEDDLK